MAHKLVLKALVAVLVVVLAGCQQTALAKPQLTFGSSSVEDEVGLLTESGHNKVKTVAGQHQSGFVRRAERTESGSRAAKPAEAALLFDGPLKGLNELPLVKELSSLILPHLAKALKDLNEAGKKDSSKVATKRLAQNEIPKKDDIELVNVLSGAGKTIFGSKSDGSDGLLNDDTFKVSQRLKQFGNVVSAAGKLVDNVKPLNTINQIGGGLMSGARSAHDNFNKMLSEALENEPNEEAVRLFKTLNTLLEEGAFLGRGQQMQRPKQHKQRQQQQQQQQQEKEVSEEEN